MITDNTSEVIARIRTLESGLSAAASGLRQLQATAGKEAFLGESSVVSCPPNATFTGTIAAIDGGIVSEVYQSCELVLFRAVCTAFGYENGKVCRKANHPSGLDGFETALLDSFDESDTMQRDSIIRLRSEIARARESVKLFSPSMVFLDGSIFPNPQDRPQKDSPAFEGFERLLAEYRFLFAECSAADVTLVGVVKDTKSRNYLDAMRKSEDLSDFYSQHAKFLSSTNDSAFLSMALEENERSGLVKIERQDLGRDLCRTTPAATYVKASKYDRPLRLEFSDYTKADAASKAVCGLCKGNSRYAYPAILIEADLRAAMDPKELEVAYARLCAKVGPDAVSLRRLRRNERPFR
ncbi:MAG: DNA double-strand break repair nuclease NurA [Candidatus Micrarchaeia archaeon]|jgi:hypothetical protein